MSKRVANHLILRIHLRMDGPAPDDVFAFNSVLNELIRRELPAYVRDAGVVAWDDVAAELARLGVQRMLAGRIWWVSRRYITARLIEENLARVLKRLALVQEAPVGGSNPGEDDLQQFDDTPAPPDPGPQTNWVDLLVDLFRLTRRDLTLWHLYELRDRAPGAGGRFATLYRVGAPRLSHEKARLRDAEEQLLEAAHSQDCEPLNELIESLRTATHAIDNAIGPITSAQYAGCVNDVLEAVLANCSARADEQQCPRQKYPELAEALSRVCERLPGLRDMLAQAVCELADERDEIGSILQSGAVADTAIRKLLDALPVDHPRALAPLDVLEHIARMSAPEFGDEPDQEPAPELACPGLMIDFLTKTVPEPIRGPLEAVMWELVLGSPWESIWWRVFDGFEPDAVEADQAGWGERFVRCAWRRAIARQSAETRRTGQGTEAVRELPYTMRFGTPRDEQTRQQVESRLGVPWPPASWAFAAPVEKEVKWALMISLVDELIERGPGRLYRTRADLKRLKMLKHNRETLCGYVVRTGASVVTLGDLHAPGFQHGMVQFDGCGQGRDEPEDDGEDEDDGEGEDG